MSPDEEWLSRWCSTFAAGKLGVSYWVGISDFALSGGWDVVFRGQSVAFSRSCDGPWSRMVTLICGV